MVVLGTTVLWSGCQSLDLSSSPDTSTTTGSATSGTQTTVTSRDPHPILDKISLPDGFHIDIFASVPNARSLAVVETGSQVITFVGNKDESNVYAAIDNDRDYKADQVITLASKLNSPNGVAYRDGDLYVAEIHRIIVFRDILTHLDSPTYEVFYDDLPKDEHHGWKYLAFWPDGRLYVPIGVPCNICVPAEPFGTIYAIDLQTKERTLIGKGIRNTVGFTRDPSSQELRFTDNGRDSMGSEIPPDELNKVSKEGEHFGYPYCHGGTIPDPEYNQYPCSDFVAPQVKLGSHVAWLGLTFYTAKSFPSSYDGQIFIAEHGSRDRQPPLGYRITLVNPRTKSYDIFAQWWLQGEKAIGRPVDIKQLSDGSLLVSDDYAGLIYRIWYQQ